MSENYQEKKKLRDSRKRYTVKEIENGRTRDELAEELNVRRCTINTYLREAGIKKDRGNMEENIAKAYRFASNGMKKNEIARLMGKSIATINNYIVSANKKSKMHCQRCGRKAKLDRFKGENLCPACLLDYEHPADKISIEYAAHWCSVGNSGAMLCG